MIATQQGAIKYREPRAFGSPKSKRYLEAHPPPNRLADARTQLKQILAKLEDTMKHEIRAERLLKLLEL